MAYETETSLVIRVKRDAKVKLKAGDLEEIGAQVIRAIERRTAKGIDKNGASFAPYSEAYIASQNFAAAGKSPDKVNLRLLGEMMSSLEVLRADSGRVTIGFEDDEQRAKAHGHIVGANALPKRDFLGVNRAELEQAVRRSGVAQTLEQADAIIASLEVL